MIRARLLKGFVFILLTSVLISCKTEQEARVTESFNSNWSFSLTDSTVDASSIEFDYSTWRSLNIPHDWSIEGEFSDQHPATAGGGALPGGIGWYRKAFSLDSKHENKKVFVQFDGVYMNSEVWVNGVYLGKRPFGYISFEYELTPHLYFDGRDNIIAVKVDNHNQPNSRWYSGSGIYRNTRLVITNDTYVAQWGSYVTTAQVSASETNINIETTVLSVSPGSVIDLSYQLFDAKGVKVLQSDVSENITNGNTLLTEKISLSDPILWSLENPHLYTLKTQILKGGKLIDEYETVFGVRDFKFDLKEGFSLNGEFVKIKGVCMHHDLGALGSAINTRAIERQLEILRDMGVNAIRTSHNPPAPELLDLCDQMGFLVMDESFDMWAQRKSPFDYATHWDEWHKKDLEDFIRRDRNHPSIVVWSTGNEILEQWGNNGPEIAKELYDVVKQLDSRPITIGMNPPVNMSNTGVTTQFEEAEVSYNKISQSTGIDLIGYNYAHQTYPHHTKNFPDKPFIATETTSGLATRGYYDVKSDTLKRWPIRWDRAFVDGNPGNTVSAYDQVSAPWGSTHEETWKIMKKNKNLSGMFIWTGFDYLGEPTPYTWPSRSSYFGVIDLAGFPKDVYYMYQSEWADQDVLHVYPHWNWSDRDSVDVWVYYNHADKVELFLNDKSLGEKAKEGEDLHIMWRVAYEPGVLKAISTKDGQEVLNSVIQTSGGASGISLTADRATIAADAQDLCYITVEVLDEENVFVPTAKNLVEFEISGPGKIVGVDNGDPTSHLSLKGSKMNAMAGKCLVIVQSTNEEGTIKISAKSEGLTPTEIIITSK
ncbi:MAG: DUF4982 domain-containing protein [Reichenbachiella sp.]